MNRTAVNVALGSVAGALLVRAFVRNRRFHLRDRTVLVTGGSRGLGFLLASEFAARGARVVICARDEAGLERARAALAAGGARVLAVRCDVTDRGQVNEMIRTVHDRLGSIDVLVNNAGIITVGPVELMTLEDYEAAMRTNFWGVLYTTLAVLPEMRWRREGRIVNITSIGGKISVPHLLPYGASKFAFVGLSEGLRAELAKDGIAVTTVCPGLMRTGSPRNAAFKGRHRAEYAWFSLGDALPVSSISARRAARQIVSACRRGDAELVVSLPAKLAVTFHALFPGLTADLLALVNRLLPAPGGAGSRAVPGRESGSAVSPSWLTRLNDRAARRYNQVA